MSSAAPFVISLKFVGDGSDAIAAANQVEAAWQRIRQVATGGVAPTGLDRVATGGAGAAADAIPAAHIRQVEDLTAAHAPLVSVEAVHEARLQEITTSYRVADEASGALALALDREKVAHQGAAGVLDAHTGALLRNNRANAQRTNLLFQLQDIGVSLASGMNPLMVAAQQGSQISMIYGPEEGGLGKALSETGKIASGVVTRLWPVALVVAAVGAAVGGMRHEIEQTSGKAVSFGDVLRAVFQVIGQRLYNTVKPAIDAVGGWFAAAWDWVKSTTRDVGNFIVREIVGATAIIGTAAGSIVPAFIVAAESAANGFTNAMVTAFRWVQEQFNALVDGLSDFAKGVGLDLGFQPISVADYVDFDFGGEKAKQELATSWSELEKNLGEVAKTDYMGDFFGDVMDQAIANFTERNRDKKAEKRLADAYQQILEGARDHIKTAEIERLALGLDQEAADRLRNSFDLLNSARQAGIELTPRQTAELLAQADAMAAADAATRRLTQIYNFGRDTMRSFFTDMLKGAREGQSALEILGNAAGNVFDSIANRALQMAADGIWDMIFGAVSSSLGTGFRPATGYVAGFGAYGQYDTGGWTGGQRGKAAGIVHGEEFVVRAGPAAANRGLLEAINSGAAVGGGGFTFAPSNHFTLSGGSADVASFERLLDARDRALSAQFEDRVEAYLANPMRRWA